MPESNLFEIQAIDEFRTTVAEPTEWLKSLPVEAQVTKLEHYLQDLQAEYDMVADAAERSRVAVLMRAARDYLTKLTPGGA